jgi:PKD repeat protein
VPTIKINRPPTAVIRNAGSLTTPVNVDFTLDGTLSTDADGTISQYLWAFDSGPVALAPGAGQTFTQQFTVPGTYAIRLIVFDDSGASSEATANIVVTP